LLALAPQLSVQLLLHSLVLNESLRLSYANELAPAVASRFSLVFGQQ
jgi:hypothetical protein